MLLIIEGANKVGKTTLINAIKTKYKNVFVINNRTGKNVEDKKTVNYLIGLATISIIKSILGENTENIVIFDRFHLSELVYGRIERNYINEGMYELDEQLYELNAKLVLLVSGYNHINDEDKKEKYAKLQMGFIEEYLKSKLKKTILTLDEELINNEISSNTINHIMQ